MGSFDPLRDNISENLYVKLKESELSGGRHPIWIHQWAIFNKTHQSSRQNTLPAANYLNCLTYLEILQLDAEMTKYEEHLTVVNVVCPGQW